MGLYTIVIARASLNTTYVHVYCSYNTCICIIGFITSNAFAKHAKQHGKNKF